MPVEDNFRQSKNLPTEDSMTFPFILSFRQLCFHAISHLAAKDTDSCIISTYIKNSQKQYLTDSNRYVCSRYMNF